MKQKAFTLAEIMIVLMVIGILTAILLPSAWHSVPDENAMKFKKANSMLSTVIRELVSSDKYYLDGDLKTRSNGNVLDKTHDGDLNYFCNTFADIVSTKVKNCNFTVSTLSYASDRNHQGYFCTDWVDKNIFDTQCKNQAKTIGEEIILADNTVVYEAQPAMTFGINEIQSGYQGANEDGSYATYQVVLFDATDDNGFLRCYKTICIDVDGIPENATASDCINECPFGYGIRADGKIISGARADEWVKKSIQDKD